MSTPIVVVAAANHREREVALDLTLAAYAEYEKDSPPEFWRAYTSNIRKAILNGSSTDILLAKDDDCAKGSVLFCEPKDSMGQQELPEMRLLAVPPEHRNQGVAGFLIDECERRAFNVGGLTLHTTHLMDTAKRMYERRGYIRFSEIDFEPVPGFIVWGYRKMF